MTTFTMKTDRAGGPGGSQNRGAGSIPILRATFVLVATRCRASVTVEGFAQDVADVAELELLHDEGRDG